jgi:serine/threonine protein kinase
MFPRWTRNSVRTPSTRYERMLIKVK